MNENEDKALIHLKVQYSIVSLDPDEFMPETLYHYTSAYGLFGILSSGILRASNFSYLNDSTEIQYGRKLAQDMLLKYINEDYIPKSIKEMLSLTVEALEDIGKGIDIYLACFCVDADLLSQWRGYGSVKGRYCIGFNTEKLPDGPKYNLYRVIYEQKEQKGKLESVIRDAIIAMEDCASDEFKSEVAKVLTKKIIDVICCLKHPGFREEKEWRVVFRAESIDNIKFDTSNGLIKPFIEIWKATRSKKLPVSEILIGSSRFIANLLKSVELLLLKYDYKDVEVKESSVPFQEF